MVYNTSNLIELTCNVSRHAVSNLSNNWVHSYDGTEIRTLRGKVENSSSKLQITFCDYRDTGTYTCRWSSSTEIHSSSSEIYVRSLYEISIWLNYIMNLLMFNFKDIFFKFRNFHCLLTITQTYICCCCCCCFFNISK